MNDVDNGCQNKNLDGCSLTDCVLCWLDEAGNQTVRFGVECLDNSPQGLNTLHVVLSEIIFE